MKRAKLVSILFAGCLLVTVVSSFVFAQPQGQPFQALQNQVDNLQFQVNTLNTTIQSSLSQLDNSINLAIQPLQNQFDALQVQMNVLRSQILNSQIFVSDISNQPFVKDQQVRSGDPACQESLFCTSWQVAQGSEIGPIVVDKTSTFFITYDGNYNWDGYAMLLSSPFVQVQLQLSKDGAPFEAVSETNLRRATWVPNHGMDIIRRRAIVVLPGKYSIRVVHRFTVFPSESSAITYFGMNEGTISVEVLNTK